MRKIISFVLKYFYATGSILFLFSVGWLSARYRQKIHAIASQFGYPSRRALRSILPEEEISKLAPDDLAIELSELTVRDGNITLMELTALARMVKARRPFRVLEIGTFDGRTALALAANSPPGARVYTLDLPPESEATAFPLEGDRKFIGTPRSRLRYLNTPYAPKITQLYGDSARFDFSTLGGSFDFIFIDGAHTYAYVLSDSRRAKEIIQKGGLIVWHDYGGWEGVTRALNELYRNDPNFRGLKRIRQTSFACLKAE